MSDFPVGSRVVIDDRGDEYHGREATVTSPERRALLSGRPLVSVRVDGQVEVYPLDYYVTQVERVAA